MPQPHSPSSDDTGAERVKVGFQAFSNLGRVLRYPDFRLLWLGAFLSFTGSWVQNVAQGHYVFHLTGSERSLSLVSFAWSLPVMLFGLVAGSFADRYDKRKLLIWAQIILALNAFFLAIATWFQFVQFWHLVLIAFLNGLVSCVEMPARQSTVSRVVPPEDLATAVPVNAMTFNVARIFGPAIGGIVLATMGVAACYFLNGISFLALVWAVLAIRADLSALQRKEEPVRDLVFLGMRYTMHDQRLRTLFFLETATAIFGLAYMALLPAYVDEAMGMGVNPALSKQGLGYAFTAVGLGAMSALLLVTHLSSSQRKDNVIRVSMWLIGFGLIGLSLYPSPWVAYPLLAVVGMGTVMQINTTNALFQLLSPAKLRGRVLAMHIWAMNGLSPIGLIGFGMLAESTKKHNFHFIGLKLGGVPLVMAIGGLVVLLGALYATLDKVSLQNLDERPD